MPAVRASGIKEAALAAAAYELGLPLQSLAASPSYRSWFCHRNRSKQSLGIRMQRILKKLSIVCQFYDLTQIHDCNSVAYIVDCSQAVAYEKYRSDPAPFEGI